LRILSSTYLIAQIAEIYPVDEYLPQYLSWLFLRTAIVLVCVFAYRGWNLAWVGLELIALWMLIYSAWMVLGLLDYTTFTARHALLLTPILFWGFFFYVLRIRNAKLSTAVA
jgi:hypothetical protein